MGYLLGNMVRLWPLLLLLGCEPRNEVPYGACRASGECAASTPRCVKFQNIQTSREIKLCTANCTTNADCPGPDNECQSRACLGGSCGFNYVPFGTPVAAQAGGDCKLSVCNGSGGVAVIADNNDVPDDGNECTDNVCAAGSPSNPPSAAGAPCSSGGIVCNGGGQCGACVPGDSKYCCGIKTSFCCNNPASPPPKPGGPNNILCCCGGTIDCDADGNWGPCVQ